MPDEENCRYSNEPKTHEEREAMREQQARDELRDRYKALNNELLKEEYLKVVEIYGGECFARIKGSGYFRVSWTSKQEKLDLLNAEMLSRDAAAGDEPGTMNKKITEDSKKKSTGYTWADRTDEHGNYDGRYDGY